MALKVARTAASAALSALDFVECFCKDPINRVAIFREFNVDFLMGIALGCAEKLNGLDSEAESGVWGSSKEPTELDDTAERR